MCCPDIQALLSALQWYSRSVGVTVRDSLLLTAVRVYDGLELEVTDPKDNQRDIEQENGES